MDTDTIHTLAFLLSLPAIAATGLVGGVFAHETGRWWPLAVAMPLTFGLYPLIHWALGG